MMDPGELDLFERSLRHATDTCSGAQLDAALAELGWAEALELDPRAAVATLFDQQGLAGTTSSALPDLLAHTAGVSADGAAGIVLPPFGGWGPPGVLDGAGLAVVGLATATHAGRHVLAVPAVADGETVTVPVPVTELSIRPVTGIDPRCDLVQVSVAALRPGQRPEVISGWPAAVARCQLAVSHELVGTARAMLSRAREHALDRIQFGRPVAGFQAVRHRLAEALVAIETAEALLAAAWLDGSSETAAMAKASAGRAARTSARHCQQVLAGVGFTTEHDLHHYVRRALLLDGLFGTSRALTKVFGDELLAGRRLPPLLPL